MNKRNTKKYYFLGVVFLLAGVIFLACGLWNVAGALSTDFFTAFCGGGNNLWHLSFQERQERCWFRERGVQH
jgi:hypothetical protein